MVTLSAGFYALADVIPELDAVNHTPEILAKVWNQWPMDSQTQAAWQQLVPQALQADTVTYLRNTSIIALSFWALTLVAGLLLHAII